MKVITITPRGFCPGVVRAIKIVEDVLQDSSYPRPIQILGLIVHNRHVAANLRENGAITVFDPTKTRKELLDDIFEGTVIITAHGADREVFRIAEEKGLKVVDATCKDVYHTHDIIRERLNDGYQVIFVGKRLHPETEAIESISPNITVVETINDVASLRSSKAMAFATNQTTFSFRDLDEIYRELKKKYPQIVIQEEICNSTRIRQEAIIAFNTSNKVDLCYIVGDPNSNNTKNLVKISETVTNTKTILIQSLDEIDPADLFGVKTISVSSGASTPTRITNEVIAYLSSFDSVE